MLKGIDPLLSPELLKILCEMGHGDEAAVVDANFTAESLGRGKSISGCRAVICIGPAQPC